MGEGTLQHLDRCLLRARGRRRARSPSTATARVSSRSGAADVLTALGVKIASDPALISRDDPRGGRRLYDGAAVITAQ